MPRRTDIKKVLLIGSGPIQIGQAAEFDFSGSQACRALREEGIKVVLVNSNPATIMTDPEMADEIYIEPLRADIIARIIEKEKPDGILSGMGGQTALNLTAELAEMGALKGVEILGTPLEAIYKGEDRQKFRDLMKADRGAGAEEHGHQFPQPGRRGDQGDRPPGRRAPRIYPRWSGRRDREDPGRTDPDHRARALPFPHPPGAHRRERHGLERDRVRSDAGCRRYLHHRLRYGERRPDGHPHGRERRRCPDPHPAR